jgi:hypothetical protein
MKFYRGLEVQFKEYFGKINFISKSYVTLTIENTDTNLLIYSANLNKIYPVNSADNDDETLPEPSPGHSQVSQVPYDEQVNQTPLMTSHEALEELAEEAEDFLYDRDIELTSHSYENIIKQAQQHGFIV